MKGKTSLMIWFLALLLCACAGGNTLKNSLPPDSTAGANELIKGNDRYQRGCYPQALAHFFKAHERFTASDHMAGSAMIMNNIGNVYRAVSDLNSALLFYEEAYIAYMDLKNQDGALQSLTNKAAALIDVNRFEEAANEIARAEKIAAGNPKLFGPLLRNQGVLLLKKGDYPRAQSLLDAALKNTDPLNLPETAAVNFALGTLMVKTDRPGEAIHHFKAALSADRSSSYYMGTADDLAAIGSVHLSRGYAELAVGYFKRAVKIYALLRNQPKVDATRNLLVEASQKAGMNIELTEFFVEKWSREEASERPCR
ncbi:MAG: tetratricopeptide repeat protein [Desulfobacterales bacterium]|nr:tetratricopeptide repeat protein [Desulfobacterales bacterium]